MKVLLLTIFTVTLFNSVVKVDKIHTTTIYQRNVIDVLDPSYPKLA